MKVAVITGSTRGIGLGLAVEFLKRGCPVVISGRSKDKLAKEVERLGERYGSDKVAGQPCDVTDVSQVQTLWNAAKKKFGRVDIWINNAGITHTTKLFVELDPGEIRPVIDTNITGLIYGSHVALRGMMKQGYGQIYNLLGHGSDDRKRITAREHLADRCRENLLLEVGRRTGAHCPDGEPLGGKRADELPRIHGDAEREPRVVEYPSHPRA